jgi:hypothetical protein
VIAPICKQVPSAIVIVLLLGKHLRDKRDRDRSLAVPSTDWLTGCVALDAKGFIKTGRDLSQDDLGAADGPLARAPHLLERTLHGVFAAGDAQGGNIKCVASAVGAGHDKNVPEPAADSGIFRSTISNGPFGLATCTARIFESSMRTSLLGRRDYG